MQLRSTAIDTRTLGAVKWPFANYLYKLSALVTDVKYAVSYTTSPSVTLI